MAELREVYESLDLALRIGEVQLSSGAGAADVTASMLAVTHACGLRNVSADVTFADLTLHHQPSIDEPAAIQIRRLIRRRVDYADLTEVDQTVADLVEGHITREEARDQVARIVSTGPHRRRGVVTRGWGVLGVGRCWRFFWVWICGCTRDRKSFQRGSACSSGRRRSRSANDS